jgi:excinuclease ABC subunit A
MANSSTVSKENSKKAEERPIIIKEARTHNLKNVDVVIPRNKLTVVTGVSGSGKSSLAFDTIYAEGQRRYVESLSTYARQFIKILPRLICVILFSFRQMLPQYWTKDIYIR